MTSQARQSNPAPVVLAVGNDAYDAALEYAVAEAVRAGCGLHLVHAIQLAATGPETVLLEFEEFEEIGRSTLAEAAERALDLLPDGVPLTTQLIQGPIVPKIVEGAGDDARLIVLQRRSLGRLLKVVTRSVSSGVAARARVPVVSVPEGWSAAAHDDERVVSVGIDEPERSHVVLAAALTAAHDRGATLRVVHTWWFPNVYDDVLMKRGEDDTWAKRAKDEIGRVLHELGETSEQRVRIEVRSGHAADALVQASDDSVLLVVGRHDPVMPLGSHLGPVARAVLREAACPVLLVDPRG